MIQLTFPDNSVRDFDPGITGREVAEGISKSLAKKAVAMALDGDACRPRRSDRSRRADRDRHPRRSARAGTDPPRRRPRDGRGRAGALSRHAGHHRAGDRERLLLRFLPQRAVHHGRPAGDREEDARDHPAQRPLHQGGVVARRGASSVFADKGETFKVELVDAIPEDQQIKIYRQGDWFDLCRGPHMTSTGQIGDAFKLMKVAGAYWRGDSNNPMLTRIYGTAWHNKAELDAYLHMLEEAEKRDHRRLGREMDLFHFQEEGPGVVFWHAKGWTLFQDLIAYMRRRLTRRLSGGQRPAGPRQGAVGDLGPLGLVPREHVHGAAGRRRDRRQRARLRDQADELPGPHPDLQARPEELSRPAVPAGRVRRRPPLRAVGRAARADARARLHPGRCARLLHRGADGGGVPEDQRPDPVDLCRLRLRGDRGQAVDAAGEAGRLGRAVGPRRGDA